MVEIEVECFTVGVNWSRVGWCGWLVIIAGSSIAGDRGSIAIITVTLALLVLVLILLLAAQVECPPVALAVTASLVARSAIDGS